MHFVLALHSHLPWVLNHGRWPHGSDWLCEAALDTYLPLIEQLRALEAARVPAPVTLGVTPVLANQLASPTFLAEMDAFFAQRLLACDEAQASLATTGEEHLVSLVVFWRERLIRIQSANTRGAVGLCLEPHDLVISKLIAGREKDLRFAAAAARAGIVGSKGLRARLATTALSDAERELVAARIDGLSSSD